MARPRGGHNHRSVVVSPGRDVTGVGRNNENGWMIEFCCTYCGRRFKVPDDKSGKAGRCPNCKHKIRVPEPRTQRPDEMPDLLNPARYEQAESSDDLTLVNIAPQAKPQSPRQASARVELEPVPDRTAEQMAEILPGHVRREQEAPPQRTGPWLIDIFFYPFNKAGLTFVGIVVGIPFLLHFLIKVLAAITLVFTPMFVFTVLFQVLRFIAAVIFFLYLLWYLCECLRDSALGGLRAPETTGTTPGVEELVWPLVRIFICLTVLLTPAAWYYASWQRVDSILLLLYGGAAFFLPMVLLALVMFDSLYYALNPILLLGSIFSTFFQYLGLVVFFCGLVVLTQVAFKLLYGYWLTFYVVLFLAVNLMMTSVHLVGRFFRRYRDKLNWEV